ncbi:hypothetical protein [Nocardia amikacinitolerans]|uniref:hypothetical protein n=1 Tax=Nocardia amikacinitolerans TaxID=756689 RepID=UPI0020A50344|nr:hypothetical protein [Nocardia amikacinitolerans]MCP2279126.1 hypothetical protein [Nocardia amikacinitolerans]
MDDALGWVDPCSVTPDWDTAQVRRLARRLGYPLRWADAASVLGLVEQVESSGADVVLLSSSAHVDAVTLDRLMSVADVECAAPRASFGRWTALGGVRR